MHEPISWFGAARSLLSVRNPVMEGQRARPGREPNAGLAEIGNIASAGDPSRAPASILVRELMCYWYHAIYFGGERIDGAYELLLIGDSRS